MKATLEFTLPEDRDEYRMAANALDYYLALCDIERFIQGSEDDLPDIVRQRFYETLEGRGIRLD